MTDYLPWAGDCRPNQSVGRASPHPLVAIKKLNKILENERKTQVVGSTTKNKNPK